MSRVRPAGSPVAMRRKFSCLALAVATALAAGTVGAQQARTDEVPPPQDTPYAGTVAHSRRCQRHGPGHLPRARDDSGEGRCPDPAVSAVDSRRPFADRPDRHACRPHAQRQRQAAGVEARQVQRVRVPSRRACGCLHRSTRTFQYLSGRTDSEGFEITDRMMDMEWSKVALYPAGYFSRGITFAPSMKLPHGWQLGTALETASQVGRHRSPSSRSRSTTWSIRRSTRASTSSASISIRAAMRRCTWTSSPMRRSIWR